MTGSWEGGAISFSQADAPWKRQLDSKKMASVGSVGQGLSTGTLKLSLQFSPQEASNPVFHHILQATLPPSAGAQGKGL